MARGFGATLGVGTTDRIATTFAANATLRSYAIWINRHGPGAANAGAVMNKSSASTATEAIFRTTADAIGYTRVWSTGTGTWTCPGPSADTWAHILITYDSGATTNDPVMYLNGVSQTVTETSSPSGTRTDDAQIFALGNRFDALRNWDGLLAEWAVWDRLLTPGEAQFLALGGSPLRVVGGVPVSYVPLYGGGPNEPEIIGRVASVTATKGVGSPPIIQLEPPGCLVYTPSADLCRHLINPSAPLALSGV